MAKAPTDPRITERGPRWALWQRLRPGQDQVAYADTAEEAERLRQNWTDEGRYVVIVYPPDGAVDLVAVGRGLAAARAVLAEQTSIARAAALRAAEEGRPEAAIARDLGVDRMTVRKWTGKHR